jgi:hypothetical protein
LREKTVSHQRRCAVAIKVKSFGMELRPLKTMLELKTLDDQVNEFIAANNVTRVISVSDAPTTDNTGETIGLVRVVAYEV